MRKWVRTSARTALLTAGFVALGSGIAMADSENESSGDGSVLSGNQAVVEGNVPVNVSGNAVAVLGLANANANDTGSAVVHQRGGDENESSGDGAVGSGNQIVGDVNVPVNACGNAVGAVVGLANANCNGSAAIVHDRGGDENETSGDGAVLGGNQVVGDVNVPVNVSGNAVSVIGLTNANADNTGSVVHQSAGDENETSGDGSVLSGNQLDLEANVPVNVSGNAVAVLGLANANANDTGSAVVHQSAGDENETSGDGSVLSGNQLDLEANVPVNVSGNAVAVLGLANANANDTGSAVVHQSAGDENESSGDGSVLSGNQLDAEADIPVNVCSLSVAVLGAANSNCNGAGAAVVETGHDHDDDDRMHQRAGGLSTDKLGSVKGIVHQSSGDENESSGDGSVLGGNQADVDADVPVNVCGNAVGAVIGLANANCNESGTAVVHQSGDENESSGDGSVLGGNQADVDADVPVNVTGNAVAVLGLANANSNDNGSAVVHQSAPAAPVEMSGMPMLTGPLGGVAKGLL
ncbi:small secreted domain DUF320 [Murinocardiopsis flavida]|uniref:Small secreted domain DUF320 n=1 Tax=Murinocardiopsis flavida TaxID=645275 RepID=A0A2P8D153_9ACTN|nr:chaplin family protein [Murinocardiopsis flavida]PSK90942.1 small secreted domain DUF320 [Murinocardiopsis flavida]